MANHSLQKPVVTGVYVFAYLCLMQIRKQNGAHGGNHGLYAKGGGIQRCGSQRRGIEGAARAVELPFQPVSSKTRSWSGSGTDRHEMRLLWPWL
jgi:hypothetical protein